MTLNLRVCDSDTDVVVLDVLGVASVLDGLELERIEQNVGVVEWNTLDVIIGGRAFSDCACTVVIVDSVVIGQLEVVVELEPELLMSAELLLSVLVIGVHQTFDIVVFTTLIPFTVRQCSRTVTSKAGKVGQFFQVECNILLLGSGGLWVRGCVRETTVTIEISAVHATEGFTGGGTVSGVSSNVISLAWALDIEWEVNVNSVNTVEVV